MTLTDAAFIGHYCRLHQTQRVNQTFIYSKICLVTRCSNPRGPSPIPRSNIWHWTWIRIPRTISRHMCVPPVAGYWWLMWYCCGRWSSQLTFLQYLYPKHTGWSSTGNGTLWTLQLSSFLFQNKIKLCTLTSLKLHSYQEAASSSNYCQVSNTSHQACS